MLKVQVETVDHGRLEWAGGGLPEMQAGYSVACEIRNSGVILERVTPVV